MNWEFHPEALEEYQEATSYYAERDQTLAGRFVAAVEDAIRRIVESPSAWRILDDDVRRCLTECDGVRIDADARTDGNP